MSLARFCGVESQFRLAIPKNQSAANKGDEREDHFYDKKVLEALHLEDEKVLSARATGDGGSCVQCGTGNRPKTACKEQEHSDSEHCFLHVLAS